MQLEMQTVINAPRAAVWNIITNIKNAAETISGIEKVEILEQPAEGLVGLKWRETRTLFGKTATEVMWITAAEENSFYDTRAESHGAIYTTRISLTDQGDSTNINMQFNGKPQTIGARIMMMLMGWMFRGATQKALVQDLDDIRKAAEDRTHG